MPPSKEREIIFDVDLDAARNGSPKELIALYEKAHTFSPRLLQKSLDVFISNLDKRRIMVDVGGAGHAKAGSSSPYAPVALSAAGVYRILNIGKTLQIDPQTIFDKWNGISETLSSVYGETRKRDQSIADNLLRATIGILNALALKVPKERVEPVLLHPTIQILVRKFWLATVNDPVAQHERVGLLCFCIVWNGHGVDFLDFLLQGMSAKTFTSLLFERLHAFLDDFGVSNPTTVEYLPTFACLLNQICSHSPKHKLGRMAVAHRAVDLGLRFLQTLHDHMADFSELDIYALYALDGMEVCFKLFCSIFRGRRKYIRKAMRAGFLNLLVDVSPWFINMKAVIGKPPEDIQCVFHILSSDLTSARSINVMANAVKKLSKKARDDISKSAAAQIWNKFEAILVESHAISRIISVSKCAKECDAVCIFSASVYGLSLCTNNPFSAEKYSSNHA